MTQYLSKFKYGEKFEHLPHEMELDARGELRLDRTKIDMIPSGLKGINFVFLAEKPRYIAPDFDGIVIYYDHGYLEDMNMLEIQAAKARYIDNREMVEKPRYIEEENGTLSLCSLPTDIHIISKPFEGGYFLDLTRTSIGEKQNLGGFKDMILYPKKSVQQELPLVFPKKIAHHKGRQMVHEKPKIYE